MHSEIYAESFIIDRIVQLAKGSPNNHKELRNAPYFIQPIQGMSNRFSYNFELTWDDKTAFFVLMIAE